MSGTYETKHAETGSAPTPLIEVTGLHKQFASGGRFRRSRRSVHAVDDLAIRIHAGETFALVGESGCGKSTTARLMLSLQQPTSGDIRYKGTPLSMMSEAERRDYRRRVQVVFQDSNSSLNPRKRLGTILTTALTVSGAVADARRAVARAHELMEDVGLSPSASFFDRYPHELSGGQRQRVGIARALAPEPELIIADEPVSALDISVRAQILQLLQRIQRERSVAYLFISHDLSVVRWVAHRVGVMYLGRLVETGPVESVFTRPVHPYTEVLINATPVADPERAQLRHVHVVSGDVPSTTERPSGCPFHPRCPLAVETCRSEVPELLPVGEAHAAACLRATERVEGLRLP
ncbi:MAG: ABC transporter ATP-binding protein [Spirochaetaceae bacterium]|nr:MAG: ABC transporter ATP-binding protein [Spirochaetaceae bacterium]